MSDRQSKNYEEVKKSFYSSISGRTRAKRDVFCEITAEAQGIGTASRDISRERKRKRQMEPAPSVRGERKSFDIDVDETEMERVYPSEFISKRKCSASMVGGVTRQGLNKGSHEAKSLKNVWIPSKKPFDVVKISPSTIGGSTMQGLNKDSEVDKPAIERVDESELISKKKCYASMIGGSTMQGLNKGFHAAKSWKNVESPSKKPFATVEISPSEIGGSTTQGLNKGFHAAKSWKNVEIPSKKSFASVKISPSTLGGSSIQRLNKGFHAIHSGQNVDIPIKKPFATVKIAPDVVRHRRIIVQKGNDSGDSEEEEFERIDKAQFISHLSFSMSKIGSSGKEKLGESFSVATPRMEKYDRNSSKRETSTGYCESFCPKDSFRGSDHAWPHESSSFILIESDSDKDDENQRVDEADLMRHKIHSKSMTWKSADKGLCDSPMRKNIGGPSKRNISIADLSASFAPGDCYTADNSVSLAKRANKDEYVGFRENKTKGSEGLPRKSKSPLNRQRYSPISYKKKKTDIVKVVPFNTYLGSSSKDGGRDSCKGQADRSSSSAEKVKNDDDTDSGIERIDESEFRNLRKKSVLVSASSTQKNVSIALRDSELNSYGANQETGVGVANRTRSKRGCIKKPAEDDNVSFEFSDSSSSDSLDDSLDVDFKAESSDDDIELFGSHDEACDVEEENVETGGNSSYHADAEEGLIGTVCRWSKQFDTPKGPENVKGVTGLHPEDQSQADDHSCDDTEETMLDLHVRAKTKTTHVVNEMKVPTGSKEAAPPSHSKDGCDRSGNGSKERTEAISSQSHVPSLDVPDKTRVLTRPEEAAPPSHSKDIYDRSGNGTKGRIGETGSQLNSHAENMTADMANEKVPAGPKETAPPSNSKDFYDHSIDGTKKRPGATGSGPLGHAKRKTADMAGEKKVLRKPKVTAPTSQSKDDDHTKERAKTKIAYIAGEKMVQKRPKETASPSQSKDVDDHTEERTKTKTANMAGEKVVQTRPKETAPPSQSKDVYDHTKERTGVTSSGSREQLEDMTSEMADEMEDPTEIKQVSSNLEKDLCSVLADAVLGRGQIPKNKDICEEAEQVPAFQTPDTLPLKFTFEDEVPQQEEKTEYEKEIDGLFDDLDRDWALDELQSFDYAEDKFEKENSPAEETQHERCLRGKHELVLEDDEGLICIFCRHVEIGPKDVMPDWAERTHRESGRKRYHEMDEPLNFYELHMHSSTIDDDDDVGNSSDATGTVWSLKPGVRGSMYEHQQEGFEFLWKNLAGSINIEELKSCDPVEVGGCIISHAPGTGKTRLTIVFLETYISMFPKCRPVIISPASTLLTWEEEFRKWNIRFPFHNLSNPELSGKENRTALRLLPRTKIRDTESVRMLKICSWDMGGSILGISYSLFEKLTGDKNMKEKRNKKIQAGVSYNQKLKKILLEKPGLVVLDEGHTPRNQRSNIWNVLCMLQTQKRVILSGTPFQNNFGELRNTLRIVRPAMADGLSQEKTFADMVSGGRRASSSRIYKRASSQIPPEVVEKLKIRMSPFVHIHKGTILQQNLPGLRDCVILLKPPALQKSLIERLGGASNFKHEHEVAMTSVHPYLFLQFKSSEDRKIGVDMAAVAASKLNFHEGVKTRFLLELVRLSLAVKEKVLVFSQYIDPLELIKEQLVEVFKWVEGREILHIIGRQCSKNRQTMINQFNDPLSESKIMLASTKCCSEGISLVGASRVVLLDVVWNPSVERQAICRAYRIGQKKFVHTYHLMTSGTSEADKYCKQMEKERLSELVFSSSNTSNQQKHLSLGEDRILEVMVANESLKEMFEKIINQPKETDLIQSFGLL